MISFIYLISIISPHYEATKAKRSFKLLFLLIQQMASNRTVISVDPDMRGKFCLLSFCLLLVIQSFFEGQSASWDVAKKEQNRTKNRYGNIIACKKKGHPVFTDSVPAGFLWDFEKTGLCRFGLVRFDR